ncbi:MAG: NYN domain-containing protein [Planctomycetaceae bacterium]
MARPFFIIDGYNLLHAAGMARRTYGPGELEKSRNELLNFLAYRLSPGERERTSIVFDAGDAPYDTPQRTKLHEMSIVFAARGGDADSVIERLIELHSAPRQIRLVSSDHRLQKAARRRRATPLDSEVFFVHLQERPPRYETSAEPDKARVGEEPKFSGEVSPAETQALLEIFGDVEQIKDEISDEVLPTEDTLSLTEGTIADKQRSHEDEGDDEELADISDAEWLNYLGEIPDDLDELLADSGER